MLFDDKEAPDYWGNRAEGVITLMPDIRKLTLDVHLWIGLMLGLYFSLSGLTATGTASLTASGG